MVFEFPCRLVRLFQNGFAVRYALGGNATVRMFDNDGNPTTGDIDLATVTEKPIAAGGGRGDSAGFHGNGVDAYVAINNGTDDQGNRAVWITVLNTDGTVRYSRTAVDDLTLTNPSRTDAAIDPSGRVLAVFSDPVGSGGGYTMVMGRLFDASGNPEGKTFYVSEIESPELALFGPATNPRVAWRNGLAAVIWESQNSFDTFDTVVAVRLFSTFKAGSIESVGLTRIVPDTPVINPDLGALGNWEPYASVLGDSAFLIEGNTFADQSTTEQRYVVAVQPVAGGAMKLAEAFYADDGTPFKGAINLSRQNGNPGRVAGDKRPGAVNYMTGGEASPHGLPEFQSDNRWNGFDRLSDGRYATVETFQLDPSTLAVTPLSKALDAVNGRLTTGFAPGNQITRFGGDIAALDNGNFVVAVDDRSQERDPGNITTAVIFAPDGSVVKDSFVVDTSDIWSNVAAFKGGFCVRVHANLFFFDNDGNLQGQVDQSTSGASFDAGRGDGTRIAAHINSPYVYLAGKVTNGNIVKVAVWDARDRSFVTLADISEAGFAGDFDRANLAVDALNRIVVSWVSQPPGYEAQQVAARVLALDAANKTVTPLTTSFLPFVNQAKTGGIRTLQTTVAMTTRQICIAAKGEINLANKPELGADSPQELNFFTVFSHPDPKADPTPRIGGGGALGALAIARSATGVTITWDGNGKLQSATSVTGSWTDVTAAGGSFAAAASGAAQFFRLTQ